MRYLIANADDFGLSPGVNQGITEAHEQGIVTSASLMVRWPAAAEAAAYGRAHLNLSLGLHVDLGEWIYGDGRWVPVYEVVPLNNIEAVEDEVARQLAIFRRLVGRNPTHIDSHQHVHRTEPVRSALIKIARELVVPLRHYSVGIRYCGDFYGQTGVGESLPGVLTVDSLLNILVTLRPGITELGCHPGKGDDLDSIYWRERAEEVKVLCDARLQAAIIAEGIELRSFRDFRRR